MPLLLMLLPLPPLLLLVAAPALLILTGVEGLDEGRRGGVPAGGVEADRGGARGAEESALAPGLALAAAAAAAPPAESGEVPPEESATRAFEADAGRLRASAAAEEEDAEAEVLS